ncbi:MAG: HEAT repeat domain-containing protein, partial [Vicinamibacteria bacterium]
PAVVRSLGEALAADNRLLRLYILDALQAIHSAEAFPYLLPLLAADGDLPGRTIEVIGSLGTAVVPELKTEFERAPYSRKRALITTLARIRGRDAISFLLGRLLIDEPEIVKEITVAFKLEVNGIPDAERRDLGKRVEGFLATPKVLGHPNAVIGAIRILGYLGEPAAKRTVLAFTAPPHSPSIRKIALLSLRRLLSEGSGNSETLRKLLSYLGESDTINIVQPALELLYSVDIPVLLSETLLTLARSESPPVRKFALRKLANYDNARIARELIEHLMSEDPLSRETAGESLGRLSSARVARLDRLEATTDIDPARTRATESKSHSDTLGKGGLGRIGTRSI